MIFRSIRRRLRKRLTDLFHNEVTAWVVLAGSLIITIFGWYIAFHDVERRASDRFLAEVEDVRQRIFKRLLDYEQVLRGGTALFESYGRQPTREEWKRYVSALDLRTHFPGVQGIGYAVMLAPAELPGHLETVRAQGFPGYRVRPEGERDAYSAVVYLEPFDWRNRRAFGYDMFSDPMRRTAMEQARDTGKSAVSAMVTLQETGLRAGPGFLVYLPVYRRGMPVETVDQRQAALAGFVYSPVRAEALMGDMLDSQLPDLGFALYDGPARPDALLYRSDADTPSRQGAHRLTTTLALPGRTWTAEFHSRPSFDAAVASVHPQLIAFGGMTVDVLLFSIIWFLAGERRRVESRVEAMTGELSAYAHRMELAQQSAEIGTWDLNLQDGTLYWDPSMLSLYGVIPENFGGTFEDWARRIAPGDLKRVRNELERAVAGEKPFHTQFRIVCPDGRMRALEAHGLVQHDGDGRPVRVTGINRDITQRRTQEEQLRLAASVFDHAHEGIAITDADERIIAVNPTFTEVTGYTRDEVIGCSPRVLKSGRHDAAFYAEMWARLNSDGYWRGEIWNRRKDGTEYPELLTISAVRRPGGDVSHYVGVFSDISALKEHQFRLEQLAHFDALTQLPNRVLLADRMCQAMALARRNGTLLAVCYLDLDGFKPINDQYGHEFGDRLLVMVAERLAGHLRESDSAARLGGDEFALLLNGLQSRDECNRAIERLLQALSEPYRLGKARSIVISASVGITLYPDDNVDADTLLRHADQAMYLAKQSGRNRHSLFDPEHDRRARARFEALTRIEAAFEAGQFLLHYQPKVDLRQGSVVGVEALIRWLHPERGLIPPGEFLPLVEDTAFATLLGDWVLKQTLAQMNAWAEQGLELTVSVNISGAHLQQRSFAARLAALLSQYPRVRHRQLELEVLETTALDDIARVSRVIDACRALGVSVALDDFGTGYSSLTYLKRLPADTLKIDRSFVRDMLSDPEDLTIIEGIIGLAQAFRRRVVAEGVESEEHGVLLLQLGCELAQGYAIARPMPADDLPAWIDRYRQPAAWQEAARIGWLREDLPLVTAELVHRRWVEDLVQYLEGDPGGVPLPPLTTEQCRFGQWYDGPARERYAGTPELEALAPAHEQVHAVGRELLELHGQGRVDEAQRRIPELLALRDEVLVHLRVLQASVARQVDAVR